MTQKTKVPLPDRVTVLGIPFRVEVVDEVDDEESAGECVGELRLIRIADSQDTRRRWTTLLHEYMHATLWTVGASSGLPDWAEEMIVQSLEHSLELFMLDHGRDFLKALDVER